MMRGLFTKKSKQQLFWEWFAKNTDLFFHFEKDQDTLFLKLKTELQKIHPDLVFEFSPIIKNSTREFIVSADGIKSLFPIVMDLVNQAPILKKWKIVAFRQSHNDITQINYENLIIKLNDVYFRYGKDSGQIALELNIRGFYESPEWTAATFILLDTILGEYHTEISLSAIHKKKLDENEVNILLPISALLQVIQGYQLELSN